MTNMLDSTDDTPRRTRPYFFLSYAHMPQRRGGEGSDPNKLIRKLYDLLCEDVMTLSGVSDDVGFMDRDISTGDDWPDQLAEALATCRVFVPLYSPHYFKSGQCGREWAAFARRIDNYRAMTGITINAIVPALYTPIEKDQLPPVARVIHYKHPDMGPLYEKDGFFGIIKRKGTNTDFRRAVFALAHRIVDVVHSTDLPAAMRSNYHALTPAFGGPYASGAGRHAMHVAITALDTSTPLPAGRSSVYYGPTVPDWNPYHPATSDPLSRDAVRVIADADFDAEIARYEDCHEQLVAEVPSAPALVLVDPWSTLESDRQSPLRHLDSLDRPWVRALVPWSATDSETENAKARLMEALKLSLPRMLYNSSPDIRHSATAMPKTVDEFWDNAALMVRAIGQCYLRRAPTNIPQVPGSSRLKLEVPTLDEGGESS